MEFSHVEQARALLRDYFPTTRLVPAASLASPLAGENAGPTPEVHLKLESELPTGSFKPRGAFHALWQRRGTVTGVVTASTGNHGAAVAYAARLLDLPATIFLPQNPNPVKRGKIARLGAGIVEAGHDVSEALQRASAYAQERALYFLQDGCEPDLLPATATIACEIFEQLPGTAAIYVPIGDTALIQGVAFAAKHLNPNVRIIGVQAERAPAYYLSWKQGRAVTTESCDTIADGLASRVPLEDNVTAIRELVDEVRLVSEEEMLRAIRRLLLDEHVVAEAAGAAAVAAFLQNTGAHAGAKVVLLVTGSNITPEVFRRACCQ